MKHNKFTNEDELNTALTASGEDGDLLDEELDSSSEEGMDENYLSDEEDYELENESEDEEEENQEVGQIKDHLSVERMWQYDGSLTYKQNEEIIQKLESPDLSEYEREQLENDFVKINRKLVYNIMHKLRRSASTALPPTLTEEDLKAAGMYGFTKALRSYNPNYTSANNPSAKSSFSTYAYRCIENEMRQLINSYRKSQMSEQSIEDTKGRNKDGGDGVKIIDLIPDRHKNPEEKLSSKSDSEHVQEVLKGLSPMAKFVLMTRYEIKAGVKLTQKEIADYVGMSQANVSKIERSSLSDLKPRLKALGYGVNR